MTPKTIVITGASDGIGAGAARQLHDIGHRVVIVGRSPEKTEAVAAALGVPFHIADFADLSQVRTLVQDLLDAYPRIDVLANNAGGTFTQRTTVDGHDLTMQVNHFAPFLLTTQLLDRLIESDAAVIQTSSVAHRAWGDIDVEDLDNQRKWSAQKSYGDAKLANVLFTKELDRRYRNQGISAAAFHPGAIATNFASEGSGPFRFAYHSIFSKLFEGVDAGASRLTWLADGEPGVTWEHGGYYAKNALAKTNPQVDDAELAQKLWERSETLVGV
ncbi:SDR family NAD(P)-dependent oxidoreductase [Demequina sediminicola]|uniref:SDR family NAD(P)-dependent oxidoreductase n=1 Tax=Demequina sediminicola TaxID=1095026 RepID=UPI00078317B8|nr:SDR family NAD(P)-dependent oxidoreductase [Demequina sediminicola]